MHPKPVNTAFGSLSGGQNAPDPSNRRPPTYPVAPVNKTMESSLFRKEHRVDNVNHAVACDDIRLDHMRIVNHYAAACCLDGKAPACDGLGGTKLHHIVRRHVPRHHMIGENSLQLLLVLWFE